MKILSILIFYFVCFSANATVTSPDPAKFISVYRQKYEISIARDLYASPAENQDAQKLRQRITDYLSSINYQIPDSELEKRWRNYIKLNFDNNIQAFEKKLKDSYLSLNFVRDKFIQNQYLDYYFSNIVQQRVQEDIKNRNKIFNLAQKENISVSNGQVEEFLLQLQENWGGEFVFSNFLSNNQISEEDLKFFIKSDLLKDAFVSKILNQELKQDSNFAKSVSSAIYNHFTNINANKSPDFYFTQAFISNTTNGAVSKMLNAREIFTKQNSIKANPDLDSNIEISVMATPINKDNEIYHRLIKNAAFKLGGNGLLATKEISPLIITPQGLHLIQLNEITMPDTANFDKAKTIIYKKLKNQKIRDFDKLFAEML